MRKIGVGWERPGLGMSLLFILFSCLYFGSGYLQLCLDYPFTFWVLYLFPLLVLHLFCLFMYTCLVILRVFPFSELRLCVLMRSLTRPPVMDKLQLPNRLLHYQRPILLNEKSPASTVHSSATVVNVGGIGNSSGTPLHSECHVVILCPCFGAFQGADGDGGALWHLSLSYWDSFEDLMIQETVLYPRPARHCQIGFLSLVIPMI